MIDVGTNETTLFFQGRVFVGVASPRLDWVVIVVAPLCKMIREFKTWGVGGGVFKINDNELSVCIFRKEERRWCYSWLCLWNYTKDVAVLCLL